MVVSLSEARRISRAAGELYRWAIQHGQKKKLHTEEQIESSINVFQGETDRACGVLGSALLEYLLGKLIEKNLTNLNKMSDKIFHDPNAPLGTFSSRINIAHALNLIDKSNYEDLRTIKDIRNKFAHNLDVHTFEGKQSVQDLCNNFRRAVNYAKDKKEPLRSILLAPRNLFVFTVVDISDDLKVKIGLLQKKPKRILVVKLLVESNIGDHFYTTSTEERDRAISNYGYKSEGIACYVYKTKVKSSMNGNSTVQETIDLSSYGAPLLEIERINVDGNLVLQPAKVFAIDKVAQIRGAMNRARRQLKPHKHRGLPFVLVLFSKGTFDIDEEDFFQAMFGKLTMTFYVSPDPGFEPTSGPTYYGKQAMLKGKNTSFSAISLLIQKGNDSCSIYTVHNPWAKKKLEFHVFNGPLDSQIYIDLKSQRPKEYGRS